MDKKATLIAGFDSYHKIAAPDHVCVPKFWHIYMTYLGKYQKAYITS